MVSIIQEHSKGKSGTLGVVIDGKCDIYPVSAIAENIDYELFQRLNNQ